MKIHYTPGEQVLIQFPKHELKQALNVLKALAKYFKAGFITRAADEVERDLQKPQLLPYDHRFHLCVKCACEIDTRKDSHLNMGEGYQHLECPPLKERLV